MKVFISWSGERSRAVAKALYQWLPDVVPQSVRLWLSKTDIDKGANWHIQLAEGLQDAQFGIICLTPENFTAPWLIFEAGAIFRAMVSSGRARVWTYLFHLKPTDVTGPLAEFQHTLAERGETRQLMQAINAAVERGSEEALLPERVDRRFNQWWPELEQVLQSIPEPQEKLEPIRSPTAMLEELLERMRSLEKHLINADPRLAKLEEEARVRAEMSLAEKRIRWLISNVKSVSQNTETLRQAQAVINDTTALLQRLQSGELRFSSQAERLHHLVMQLRKEITSE
jgi:hypothetical protein